MTTHEHESAASIVGTSELGLALELAREAKHWGVLPHVISWARKHSEQNPTASLSDCVWAGHCEWVK